MTDRRPDLDALRVFATLAVFLFHCAKFFDSGGWHLTNRPTSWFLSSMVELVALWLMPLFFVLSGASTRLALNSRSTSQLVRDRILRLMLPFAFGVLVIVAPQVWVERVGHGELDVPLWQFYPRHYFDGWYGRGGNFAWMGLHLWYLGLLFLITLLFAPILGPMTRGRGARLVAHVQAFLAAGPGLLALVALCWAVEVLLIGRRLDFRGLGGWSIVQYALFFLCGFMLVTNAALRARIVRVAVPSLACGLAIGAIYAFAPVEWLAHAPRALRRSLRAASRRSPAAPAQRAMGCAAQRSVAPVLHFPPNGDSSLRALALAMATRAWSEVRRPRGARVRDHERADDVGRAHVMGASALWAQTPNRPPLTA